MSATTSLTPSKPRPLWLDAFTMRLGELAPTLSPVRLALSCLRFWRKSL